MHIQKVQKPFSQKLSTHLLRPWNDQYTAHTSDCLASPTAHQAKNPASATHRKENQKIIKTIHIAKRINKDSK